MHSLTRIDVVTAFFLKYVVIWTVEGTVLSFSVKACWWISGNLVWILALGLQHVALEMCRADNGTATGSNVAFPVDME